MADDSCACVAVIVWEFAWISEDVVKWPEGGIDAFSTSVDANSIFTLCASSQAVWGW